MALERGEHDAALVGLVPVVEENTRRTSHGAWSEPDPAAAAPTSCGLPDFSRLALLVYARPRRTWSRLASTSLGVPRRAVSSTMHLSILAAARVGGARAGRRARDRQDPPARASSRRAPTCARLSRPHAGPLLSSSEICRSGSSSTRSTSTSEASSRIRLDALDDEPVPRSRGPAFARALAGRATRRLFQHDRYRIHAVVRELLEELAAAKPLVLVLDDLHWADSASVELLGALLRRPPDAAVLMALSLRPRQRRTGCRAPLERAGRAEHARTPGVGPLTRDEARQLLGESFDAATAAALYEDSGGNPFYLEQLAGRSTRPSPAQRHRRLRRSRSRDLTYRAPVAADLAEELALLAERRPARARRRGRRRRPVRPRAGGGRGRDGGGAGARRRGRAPESRPRPPDRAPAPLSLPPSDRAACGVRVHARRPGASARTSAARRRCRHGRRAPARHAPTTWSATRDVAMRPRSSTLLEAGEALPYRAPASAAHWYTVARAAARREAPPEERVELLLSRAQGAPSCGQFAEAHSALLESIELLPEDALALRVRLTTACAASSTCSAATTTPTPVWRPRARRPRRADSPEARSL